MATRQDLAFLRHAAGAGLMTTPGAQGCLRALEEALARGRQVSAAALAVELGLLDEATARQVLA
ncbi:MAG: hypothetical protein KIT58_05035, partial [Planctomycetota bacterium]|nr:hypothetical protein [Planctomycetota bacterium]